MRTLLCSILILGLACGTDDADGDGYSVEMGDCDDLDPEINPDAIEQCDEVDNNCDGQIDENRASDALTLYVDADGDGYGDPERMAKSCVTIPGWSNDNTDCDDTSSAISPAATEQPGNGIDEDCAPENTD